MQEPEITPLARRLAEDAGVAWPALEGAEGRTITEREVLEHLTDVVTGTLPTQAELSASIDFNSLAASLSEALTELLTETREAAEPVVAEGLPAENLISKDSTNNTAAEPPAAEKVGGLEPGATTDFGSPEHLQLQLETERRAHAQTKQQLDKFKEAATQQKARAAQLRPLAAEVQRLGSALGVANAEMERLRPLEKLVSSLQAQLEEARADEARVRLLCRGLQAQQDLLEEERKKRPRWQFWRRTS